MDGKISIKNKYKPYDIPHEEEKCILCRHTEVLSIDRDLLQIKTKKIVTLTERCNWEKPYIAGQRIA